MEPDEGADISVLDARAVRSLQESVGGDRATLVELVDAFLEDGPLRVAEVRRGAEEGDAALVRRAAHTLKGNARTFGAGTLAILCQEIERAARAEDVASVRDEIDGLDHAWRLVSDALRALRDGVPA